MWWCTTKYLSFDQTSQQRRRKLWRYAIFTQRLDSVATKRSWRVLICPKVVCCHEISKNIPDDSPRIVTAWKIFII